MSQTEIKTVIFDFGNVIGFFDYRTALDRAGRELGIQPDGLRDLLLSTGLEEAYESGRITTAEFLGRIRQAFSVSRSDDELAAVYSDIFWPNTDVCELLPRLKPGFRLLLASNTNELHARQFSHQFAKTLRTFDALVLSHEVGSRKPSRAFYEHCQQLAECAPHQCLFIDDLPVNVANAREFGWNGIVYTGFECLCKELVRHGVMY